MAEVKLESVSKVYEGKVTAVREVTTTINDQEFVVLVGPSGCGKSTVLRMIAGLEEISGGTISIDGRVVNDVAPKDRDIAMVFQNYALYPHMTVYENLAFGLKLRKYPKAEIDQRVREAAKILGIETVSRPESPRHCPADSASALPSAVRSSANPRSSSSMNRSATSTPTSASRCAPRSPGCTTGSRPP